MIPSEIKTIAWPATPVTQADREDLPIPGLADMLLDGLDTADATSA